MKTAASGHFEILCYHRIGFKNSLDGLTVSKKNFIKQMRFIRRHCHPMALEDLVRLIREGKKIPSRAVAVTFDDGYRDTFTGAFPVLEKMKIPAVIFVTTDFVDQELPMYRKAPPLTWKMILEMQQGGIEIGCHTLSHPVLAQCSPKEIKRQIAGSKSRLEQMLGKPVQFFAYPYGGHHAFNKAVMASVKKAGFAAACTTLPGSNTHQTSLYALRRMAPFKNQTRLTMEKLAGQTRRILKKNNISGASSTVMRTFLALDYPKKKGLVPKGNPFYWNIGQLVSGTKMRNKQIAVSVIMPARNVGNYIDEAIQSVLEQRGVVFELLIADDASSDGTWDRIQAYRNDSRVRIWRFRKQKRVGATGNYLMSRARGGNLAFCDADDKMLPGLLQTLQQTLERKPRAGVAFTDRLENDSSGRMRLLRRSQEPNKSWDLLDGAISNGGAIVRRELIKKVGGFRLDLPYLEDCELFWRLAEVTQFVYIKGKPLYFYRRRAGSLTEKFKKKAKAIRLKILREIIQRRYKFRVRW